MVQATVVSNWEVFLCMCVSISVVALRAYTLNKCITISSKYPRDLLKLRISHVPNLIWELTACEMPRLSQCQILTLVMFISERSKATTIVLTIIYSSFSLFYCMITMLARLLFNPSSLQCTRQLNATLPNPRLKQSKHGGRMWRQKFSPLFFFVSFAAIHLKVCNNMELAIPQKRMFSVFQIFAFLAGKWFHKVPAKFYF